METQPKPTPWKVIIPIAIVVILCCLCLAVVGVLAYMGTKGNGPLSMLASATPTITRVPTRTPTPTPLPSIEGDWYLYYDWDCSGNYNGPATITFYPDGAYYAFEGDSGGYGTWTLTGNSLDYMYNEYPYAHYIGTVNSTWDYAEGTMSTDDGSSGCWYAYPALPGVVVPPSTTVEDTPTGEWDLYYNWTCNDTYDGPALLTFFSDQNFSITDNGNTGYGTWSLSGESVDFIYDNSPHAHYIGTMDMSLIYMAGTMSTDDGSNGCWYATKK